MFRIRSFQQRPNPARPAGSNTVILGGSGTFVFEAETEALVARFSTPPSAPRKLVINSLILSAKSHGWWTSLDVLNLIGNDSQCSLLNWISTSFNSTLTAAPTFTQDRDFVTNGTSSFIDTNFNPSTAGGKYTQNSATFGFYSRSAAQASASIAGWFDGTDGTTILPRNTSNVATGRINQATASSSAANSDGTGFYTLARFNSASFNYYKNGASIASGSTPSTALNNATLRLGSTTAVSFAAGAFACWLIGQQIDTATQAVMYADILTYLTAIGAA